MCLIRARPLPVKKLNHIKLTNKPITSALQPQVSAGVEADGGVCTVYFFFDDEVAAGVSSRAEDYQDMDIRAKLGKRFVMLR
jgi:hypothetical protein